MLYFVCFHGPTVERLVHRFVIPLIKNIIHEINSEKKKPRRNERNRVLFKYTKTTTETKPFSMFFNFIFASFSFKNHDDPTGFSLSRGRFYRKSRFLYKNMRNKITITACTMHKEGKPLLQKTWIPEQAKKPFNPHKISVF